MRKWKSVFIESKRNFKESEYSNIKDALDGLVTQRKFEIKSIEKSMVFFKKYIGEIEKIEVNDLTSEIICSIHIDGLESIVSLSSTEPFDEKAILKEINDIAGAFDMRFNSAKLDEDDDNYIIFTVSLLLYG